MVLAQLHSFVVKLHSSQTGAKRCWSSWDGQTHLSYHVDSMFLYLLSAWGSTGLLHSIAVSGELVILHGLISSRAIIPRVPNRSLGLFLAIIVSHAKSQLNSVCEAIIIQLYLDSISLWMSGKVKKPVMQELFCSHFSKKYNLLHHYMFRLFHMVSFSSYF